MICAMLTVGAWSSGMLVWEVCSSLSPTGRGTLAHEHILKCFDSPHTWATRLSWLQIWIVDAQGQVYYDKVAAASPSPLPVVRAPDTHNLSASAVGSSAERWLRRSWWLGDVSMIPVSMFSG